MKRAPHIAGTLAAVYLLLSFNAYACLIPLYGSVQVAQGSDCTMPDEQSANQFCDAFKTLSVQNAPSALQLVDFLAHAVAVEPLGLQLFLSPQHASPKLWNEPPPTEDILALTSVLRL